MLPLSAGLLGSSPVAKIAVHIATALAAREMESPVVAPAMAVPDIRVTRHDRHRTAAARTPPAQTETSIMVRTPAIQINTVLDTHLPAIPAPVMAATVSEDGPEDALVCRKPERLANSRFTGPEVCLHASQWARLRAGGMDVSPDGGAIVRTDYEKQRTLSGSPCPQSMRIGASTGWLNGSKDCF
jgi:hypothetical protein